MSSSPQALTLDRYTTIGDLTAVVRRSMAKANKVVAALVVVATVVLFFAHLPGAMTFALLGVGTLIALFTWTGKGIGLPLMALLALQHLVVYGLPILIQHETVVESSAQTLTNAGIELFVFLISLAATWRIGMIAFRPSAPLTYALVGIDREGIGGLRRFGFGLVFSSTGWLLLQSLNLTGFIFDLLPSGSWPIIGAAISASSACGFFVLAMLLGSGDATRTQKILFWALLAANILISASSFLLSAATTVTAAVMIGLLWSTGRIPWRFVLCLVAGLSFLNLGKSTMRERYWAEDNDKLETSVFTLKELPSCYLEWTEASIDALTRPQQDATPDAFTGEQPQAKEGQSLLERINNLQNLLFVIDAMQVNHIAPLDGATYRLIPPLLLPRILWPDKPRTHEGQVLLNVHFGRQDLRATFSTYVAWGLLPEAYGNFGPVFGAIFLGAALGFFCAWVENFTMLKPVLSAEGFAAFVVFLGFANSYEMVASVMITSIFQSLVPVVAACAPFVRRMIVRRPAET